MTITKRIESLRETFALGRTQLFVEGRVLTLQGLPKDTAGTYGVELQPQRGETMAMALDEAEEYLRNRKTKD